MKLHVLKGVLPIGLLVGLAVPTDAIAQAPATNTTQAPTKKARRVKKAQPARTTRRGSASRRIGTGAAIGTGVGALAGRSFRGAAIGGAVGAGAGAIHNRRQRRRGR